MTVAAFPATTYVFEDFGDDTGPEDLTAAEIVWIAEVIDELDSSPGLFSISSEEHLLTVINRRSNRNHRFTITPYL